MFTVFNLTGIEIRNRNSSTIGFVKFNLTELKSDFLYFSFRIDFDSCFVDIRVPDR